jgi:aspartate/glutamate racemase
MKLRPRDWQQYALLQIRIAKLIPSEEKRPTIDLIVTESSEDRPKRSIGILGGTGPLADGELIRSIFHKLKLAGHETDWTKLAINLFSSPPPRSADEMQNRGVSYLHRLGGFATRGHHKYYLASNTAHSNIAAFNLMVQATYLRQGFQHAEFPVVDLVQEVVRQIQGDQPESGFTLLILGTESAFKAGLYPRYLKQVGYRQGDLNPAQAVHENDPPLFFQVSTSVVASEFQQAIDAAKSGAFADARARMKTIIAQEVARLPLGRAPMRIVFGCTEISMVIRGSSRSALLKGLEKQLGVEVDLMDTSQIFSDKIARDLIALTQGDS